MYIIWSSLAYNQGTLLKSTWILLLGELSLYSNLAWLHDLAVSHNGDPEKELQISWFDLLEAKISPPQAVGENENLLFHVGSASLLESTPKVNLFFLGGGVISRSIWITRLLSSRACCMRRSPFMSTLGCLNLSHIICSNAIHSHKKWT